MKKFFCFLFCFLFCFAVSASADTASLAQINFEEMTVEELTWAKNAILMELSFRQEVKEIKVPMGEYVIGVDIPAGTYTIETKESSAMVIVCDSEGNTENFYTISNGDGIGKISLTDGQSVHINLSAVMFCVYTGLGF